MTGSAPISQLRPSVMISSTFTDLQKHRAALIKALNGQQLMHDAMENDTARLLDVLDSSLQKVRDASAYIIIIGQKYGQVPEDRNPRQVSITELEFDEAVRLERPILLFIMSEEHWILARDVESDPQKKDKLNAFRERAKHISRSSEMHRVYATFSSVEDFATQAVAELRRDLEKALSARTLEATSASAEPIPRPPALYAAPPYIGSHTFVGRQAQLEVLDNWATSADSCPLMLFEAIGGTGKSMLTWHWVTQRAAVVRPDWAGRFWYSFYEGGQQ